MISAKQTVIENNFESTWQTFDFSSLLRNFIYSCGWIELQDDEKQTLTHKETSPSNHLQESSAICRKHAPFYVATHVSECLRLISTRDMNITQWLRLSGVDRGNFVYPQQPWDTAERWVSGSAHFIRSAAPRVTEAICSWSLPAQAASFCRLSLLECAWSTKQQVSDGSLERADSSLNMLDQWSWCR